MNCTPDQIDALKEIINIGVGRGASVLSTMLGSHIHLQVPSLKTLSSDEFTEEMNSLDEEKLSSVNLPFKGNSSGVAEMVFSSETALRLIAVLTNEETDTADMDSIRAGTLTEVGNIVLNAVMGTISNLLSFNFDYSIPSYVEGSCNKLLLLHGRMSDATIVLARTHFIVQDLEIEGNIMLFLELGSFDTLMEAIDANVEAGK